MEWLHTGGAAHVVGRRPGSLRLGALMSALWRRRAWIAGATALGLVVALATTGLAPARYTSQVLVQPLIQTASRTETSPEAKAADLQAQVRLIASTELARQAVARLDLVSNPEFNPPARGILSITRLVSRDGANEPAAATPEDRALQAWFQHLEVTALPDRGLAQIKFWASDPKLAADAANLIAELYVSMRPKAEVVEPAPTPQPTPTPDAQAALERSAAAAEAALEAFRARHGLVAGDNPTAGAERRLADLTKQLNVARTDEASARAATLRARDLALRAPTSEAPDGINNEALRSLAAQDAALHRQQAQDSRIYLPRHPHIHELQAQIARSDALLRTAAQEETRRLEAAEGLATRHVETLAASVKTQQRTVEALKATQTKLHALERDAAAAWDRLATARIVASKPPAPVAPSQAHEAPPRPAQIVARAVAEQPPPPLTDFSRLLVGAFSGFLLSLGVVVAREGLAGSAPSAPTPQPAEPVRAPSVAPPSLAERAVVALAAEPEATVAPPVASLAQRIAACKPATRGAAVLVCGLDAAAPGRAAALEIARDLAGARRTILVEIDGGAVDDDGPGLADLLAGRVAPLDAIRHERGSTLCLMRRGRLASGETLDPARLDSVFDSLMATYDYVVLDGPPLGGDSLALSYARWADVVVVAAQGRPGPQATAALDALVEAGAPNIFMASSSDAAAPARRTPPDLAWL